MDTLIKPASNVTAYKNILLTKLSYAVTCSVVSQVCVLFIFLIIVNFDVFEPLSLLSLTLQTFTSLSTWIYIIPFSSIIFAQSLVCAKDYILSTNSYSCRIEKFLSICSLRNLILLFLYILIGGLMVWLFLTLGGGQYESITCTKAEESNKCLNEGTIFLILSGMWTGFYYFIKIYATDKKVFFPIIHQSKIIQMKTRTVPLLNESRKSATIPTLYFLFIYHLCRVNILNFVMYLFGIDLHVEIEGYTIYLYMWLFIVLYFLSMNLMRFSFELFLTEPVAFPVEKSTNDDFCLADAIGFSKIPIIQHLACLDLYILSQWSKERRMTLFSLSQPGGHPHHWNYLIVNTLKLITDYCQCLNKATAALLNPEIAKPIDNVPSITNPFPTQFYHVRNLTAGLNDYDIVNISQDRRSLIPEFVKNWNANFKKKVKNIVSVMRKLMGIDYLFGELPEASIQHCLGNAQIMMWATQALSTLTIASITEDRYGIVQKDVPVIITTLVELKYSLDKLSRVPALNRKTVFNDTNVKMKTAISASVKRSLFGITHTFGQYLKDLPLSKDVLQHIQLFVLQKSM